MLVSAPMYLHSYFVSDVSLARMFYQHCRLNHEPFLSHTTTGK